THPPEGLRSQNWLLGASRGCAAMVGRRLNDAMGSANDSRSSTLFAGRATDCVRQPRMARPWSRRRCEGVGNQRFLANADEAWLEKDVGEQVGSEYYRGSFQGDCLAGNK